MNENVNKLTAMTKIGGMEASLRVMGQLKLLHNFKGRIIGRPESKAIQEEKYPLHVRDPKKTVPGYSPLKWLKSSEQEDLEEKTAKQDLARIYFTSEATRLLTCNKLASLKRNSGNIFKKTDMKTRSPYPHFYVDRLENSLEAENRRKKDDKITTIKREMDAFDQSVKERPSTEIQSKFDPLQPPSDRSLNDLKLKVEIMKKQRERDVQAAAGRNRTRKTYFRKMLPCFPDLIVNDLMDYSIKMASKLSGEEKLLAKDLLSVTNYQQNIPTENGETVNEDGQDVDKPRVRGLQFNEVVDKRRATEGEYAAKDRSSTVSQKSSIKFHLSENFLSKRNPVQRKKTAYVLKASLDNDDDDDDEEEEDVDDDEHKRSSIKFALAENYMSKRNPVQRKKTAYVQKASLDEDDKRSSIKFHLAENYMSKRSPVKRKQTAFVQKASLDVDDDEDKRASIKFHLAENFLSKKNPVSRKQTAFVLKASLDDDEDDDDDNGDHDQNRLSDDALKDGSSPEENEIRGTEEGNLNILEQADKYDRESLQVEHSSTAETKCTSQKRASLVYEDLGNISYGMYWPEHEESFLEHRLKELKQFSGIWDKGLFKPHNVYTIRERNFIPSVGQFTEKRMPPFNILDPQISRPKFNLRIRNLIKKADQAKLEESQGTEERLK